MNITHLRAFLDISRTMSFSETAAKFYVSQPSLSKYIKAIEEELGDTLLYRTTRRVELTDAGVRFASHVERIIAEFDKMLQDMNTHRSNADNIVKVACVTAVHQYGFSQLFIDFGRRYPGINMELNEMDMDEAMDAITAGSVDCAVIRSNVIDLEDYSVIEFNWDELVVVCGENHRFASYSAITLDEAVAERLALMQHAYPEFRRLLRQNGIIPELLKPAVQSQSVEVIEKYLSDGICISIATRTLAKRYNYNNRLVLIPFGSRLGLSIGLIYKERRLSPASRNFIVFSKQYFSRV